MTRAAPPPSDSGVRGRLGAVRERVRSVPGGFLLWRAGVTVLGVGIVVLGVILLPLPGPGWLIIFAGLGLLATEYEWAANLLRRARQFVTSWTQWLRRQPRWAQVVVGLLSVVLLVAVAVGVWLLYRRI